MKIILYIPFITPLFMYRYLCKKDTEESIKRLEWIEKNVTDIDDDEKKYLQHSLKESRNFVESFNINPPYIDWCKIPMNDEYCMEGRK